MILLFCALHYLYGLAAGAPSCFVATTTLESPDGSLEAYRTNYRSIVQIVTSCVSTIFLCTWFTVHPDIRGLGSTWRERVGRKLELFVWALLMPELVMMWACNQYFGARKIGKLMGAYEILFIRQLVANVLIQGAKFGMHEGHFVQMGGVVFLWEGKRVEAFLSALLEREYSVHFDRHFSVSEPAFKAMRQELRNLHKRVTRDEIKDRSKSDALSKTVVLVQTSWFAAQCIARAAQGLAITELEIVTLAYTVLNGVMCFFWWSKPLGVQCPVCIELSPGYLYGEMPASADRESASGVSLDTEIQPLIGCRTPNRNDKRHPGAGRLSTRTAKILATLNSGLQCCSGLKHCPKNVYDHLKLSMQCLAGYDELRDAHPFKSYTKDHDPKYYISAIIVTCLASLFGAIHCISWSFTFPSPVVRTVWQVCSVFIASSPLVLAIMPVVYLAMGGWGRLVDHYSWVEQTLRILNFYVLAPLYIVARIILIVIAFCSLSTIPATGYQSIEWADFVPHI
ncbi:hypothetical protein MD484_g2479, partial [Candolleomyces efflorescens]